VRGIGRPAVALRLAVAGLLLAALSGSPTHAEAASGWTGGIDLYRSGVFTTQKSWLWCTAADVQIIRNIARHETDHSRAAQQRYFDYMRARNRYRIPLKDGVDPAGWEAGLRHFVDGRYRLVASTSFDTALRSAVTNLRKTNLPVGITVSHGNHAWVLTGFTATADPATTSRFTVTSVRVVGPLYGLQSRSFGYDMRPDTKLTPRQLRSFFTPWHYSGVRMAWEGRWVSIQPIGAISGSAATTAPAPSPSAAAGPPSAAASPTPRAPSPSASAAATSVALADTRPTPPPAAAGAQVSTTATQVGPMLVIALLLALAVLGLGLRTGRRRTA
jgi:hypothetical protein